MLANLPAVCFGQIARVTKAEFKSARAGILKGRADTFH